MLFKKVFPSNYMINMFSAGIVTTILRNYVRSVSQSPGLCGRILQTTFKFFTHANR